MPFTRTMSSKPLKSQKNKSIKKIGGMFSFKSNKVSSKYGQEYPYKIDTEGGVELRVMKKKVPNSITRRHERLQTKQDMIINEQNLRIDRHMKRKKNKFSPVINISSYLSEKERRSNNPTRRKRDKYNKHYLEGISEGDEKSSTLSSGKTTRSSSNRRTSSLSSARSNGEDKYSP